MSTMPMLQHHEELPAPFSCAVLFLRKSDTCLIIIDKVNLIDEVCDALTHVNAS